jgi:hypothetical protein
MSVIDDVRYTRVTAYSRKYAIGYTAHASNKHRNTNPHYIQGFTLRFFFVLSVLYPLNILHCLNISINSQLSSARMCPLHPGPSYQRVTADISSPSHTYRCAGQRKRLCTTVDRHLRVSASQICRLLFWDVSPHNLVEVCLLSSIYWYNKYTIYNHSSHHSTEVVLSRSIVTISLHIN